MKPENIFGGEEGAALLAPVPLGLHDVQVEGVGVSGRKQIKTLGAIPILCDALGGRGG